MTQQIQTRSRCGARAPDRAGRDDRTDSYRSEPMDIAEVREVAAMFFRHEPLGETRIEAARQTFGAISRSAAGYGLTPADVTRAILGPLFKRVRGCDCPTCRTRRGRMAQPIAPSEPIAVKNGGEASDSL